MEASKGEQIKVLILEDNPADVKLMQFELEKGDYKASIKAVDNEMDYIHELNENRPDVILADIKLPNFDGMEALAMAHIDFGEIPFIVVSGFLGEEATAEVIKNGATDFVSKNNLSRLNYSIYRALMEYKDRKKRIEAERELVLSEERYRLLAENMLDMVCLHDPDGTYTWVSPSSKQLLGYEPKELLGINPYSLFHPEDIERISKESHDKVLTGEKESPLIEYRIKRKDGQYVWLETITKSILDSSGNVAKLQTVSRDITERMLVELREQENRELFQALFSKSADGIFLVDCETDQTIDCNEQATKMFEVDNKDELIGVHTNTLQKNDFAAEELYKAQTLLNSGKIFTKQLMYNTKKGNTFWGNLAITRIEVAGRRVDVVRVTDVSDRIRLQEEFDQFFNLSIDLFSLTNPEGYFTQLNPAWERVLGYTQKELYQTPMMDIIHPDDREKTSDVLQLLKKTHSIDYFENRVLTKSGEVKYLVWSAVVIEESKVTYSVARDITEQKVAALELEKNRDFLKQTQAMAMVGSFEYDMVNAKLYWSDEMYRLFGLKPRSFDPQLGAYLDRVYPADVDKVKEVLRQLEQGEPGYELENRIVREDGEVRILHAKGEYRYDEEGNAILLLGTCQDITERKRIEEHVHKLNSELEARVRKRTKELEAANKELEAFNFTISHELRMPLRAAEIFSEQLEKKYADKLDSEGSEYITSMVKCIDEMGMLIHDVLAFSKVSKQEKRNENIEMQGLIKSILSELLAFGENDSVDVQMKDLPEAVADRNMMKQVWVNLLSNAIKYSKPKDQILIEVGGYYEDDEIIYYVKDNGVGFSSKDKDKLFQAFERLHSGDLFEGTGVGLAIVERIVTRHGGSVWAESEVNKGATFFFSLPKKGNEVMASA